MNMPESNTAFESRPELELVLMIVSQDPRSTALQVSNLTSLAEYVLVPDVGRTLHDIYLDTPNRLLGRKRINLRIRGSEGSYWVTMKVSPGLLTLKRHEREEIEVPWSQASLNQIVERMSQKGIRLKLPGELDGTLSQVEVMKSMGLEVLQDRDTQRTPRNVVESEDSGKVLAELAIDSIVYHFDSQNVRLFEVELEAKSEKGRRILGYLSKSLTEKFRRELKSWRFGKLVTGRKIEQLLRDGALEDLQEDGILRPTAYEKIERA